jgi:hypothetical protein
MNELKNDKNLREAVSRREQKLPPMPDDLNERLMQRLEEPETAPVAKQRPLWLYAAIAVAASILLLIIFHFGQAQTPQEPVVAQNVEHPVSTVGEPAEPPVPEPVEGEPVEGSAPKPSQQPTKKQRKVVMQLVELIPTSEAKSENVKKLPASLIDKVKAYDQASDPSRTTGIDDGTDAIVTSTTVSDAPDPLVTMTAQVEDIRQRGKRLEREIELRIEELKN